MPGQKEVRKMTNPFVLKRLKAKPVTYTVELSHFAAGGAQQFGVVVRDIRMDAEGKRRVAADLRLAAEWIEAEIAANSNDNASAATESEPEDAVCNP
jgi:hypothetical protein